MTGTSDQRLTAALDVTGNFRQLTPQIRSVLQIQPKEQLRVLTVEGFISMPTFDFGKMHISSKNATIRLEKSGRLLRKWYTQSLLAN